MTIPRLHPDFEDFLHALCDAAADFLVVGAVVPRRIEILEKG